MDFEADLKFQVVFMAVLLVRFLLPFAMFRYPLPTIIGCLIVDAADQTVFQAFGYDPPFYQNYDKAMDVFYLGIAYISTLRNWTSRSAIGISRFLFFYRQTGVVAFELVHWRTLLLIFPNTFEYFFIAYELVRLRWDPARLSERFWMAVAAGIWVFIKLPQEYWIHIAKMDVTDTLREVPWAAPALAAAIVVGLAVLWFVVRPRLAPFDHAWQVASAGIPEGLRTARQRADYMAAHGKVWTAATLEKTALIGFLLVIFASIMPAVDVGPLRLLAWVGAFVAGNAAVTLIRARAGRTAKSLGAEFGSRFIGNLLALGLVDGLLYDALPLSDSMFFAALFSILLLVYDLYRPVYDRRFNPATT